MAALRVSAPEPISYCMPEVLCQEQAFRATAWQSGARNVGYGKLLLEVDRSQPSFGVLVYALFVRRQHSICTRSARAPAFPSRALHQAGAAPADSSVTPASSFIIVNQGRCICICMHALLSQIISKEDLNKEIDKTTI